MLVYNSNFTMVYGAQITIVMGVNLNQQTSLGGPTLYIYIYTMFFQFSAGDIPILRVFLHHIISHHPDTSQTKRSPAKRAIKGCKCNLLWCGAVHGGIDHPNGK